VTVLHSGASTNYSDNWAEAFGEAKPRRVKKKATTQRTRPAKKKAAAAKRKGVTTKKKASAKRKGAKARKKSTRRA
jgi:hypothetical protein